LEIIIDTKEQKIDQKTFNISSKKSLSHAANQRHQQSIAESRKSFATAQIRTSAINIYRERERWKKLTN
jgi:hypothetical protein